MGSRCELPLHFLSSPFDWGICRNSAGIHTTCMACVSRDPVICPGAPESIHLRRQETCFRGGTSRFREDYARGACGDKRELHWNSTANRLRILRPCIMSLSICPSNYSCIVGLLRHIDLRPPEAREVPDDALRALRHRHHRSPVRHRRQLPPW